MGQGAVAAAVGVDRPLAVTVCLALSVTVPLGKQDLPHAHSQKAKGRQVLSVLCTAVMAAVRVTATQYNTIQKNRMTVL